MSNNVASNHLFLCHPDASDASLSARSPVEADWFRERTISKIQETLENGKYVIITEFNPLKNALSRENNIPTPIVDRDHPNFFAIKNSSFYVNEYDNPHKLDQHAMDQLRLLSEVWNIFQARLAKRLILALWWWVRTTWWALRNACYRTQNNLLQDLLENDQYQRNIEKINMVDKVAEEIYTRLFKIPKIEKPNVETPKDELPPQTLFVPDQSIIFPPEIKHPPKRKRKR